MQIKSTRKSSRKLVYAIANHGRRYAVEFDKSTGEILNVGCVIDRHGVPYERVTWDSRWGVPMTITAACAGRAALAELDRRKAARPAEGASAGKEK